MLRSILCVPGFLVFLVGCATQRDAEVSSRLPALQASDILVESGALGKETRFHFSYRLRPIRPGVVGFELKDVGYDEMRPFCYQGEFAYEGGFERLVQDMSVGLARAAENYVPRKRESMDIQRKLTVLIQRGPLVYRFVLEGKSLDIEDYICADPSAQRSFFAICCRAPGKMYRIIDVGTNEPGLADRLPPEIKK